MAMFAMTTMTTTMRKKRTTNNPPPGRGQEDFDGDISDAFARAIAAERERRERARTRAYREALDRARERPTGATGGRPRGPLRPYLVGWRTIESSYDDPLPRTTALGRTVILGSSVETVQARAARYCCKEAGIRPHRLGGGFQIRYIKEQK